VEERRARYPDMHVYHYAPYEKTALRHLSLNHVAGEDVVDSWLRDGLLVDLYATVRHSLRISEASYSIKKLEPLYMGDNLRSGDVKDAGASVVAYAAYCEARDAGPERRRRRRPSWRPFPTTTSTTAFPRCACATGCCSSPGCGAPAFGGVGAPEDIPALRKLERFPNA
jgi:hypothetical protein